jgi:hypothetical protein
MLEYLSHGSSLDMLPAKFSAPLPLSRQLNSSETTWKKNVSILHYKFVFFFLNFCQFCNIGILKYSIGYKNKILKLCDLASSTSNGMYIAQMGVIKMTESKLA